MTTIRDVLRIVGAVGTGAGTAGYAYYALRESNQKKIVSAVAGAGIGTGAGLLVNVIGKVISDWKDTPFKKGFGNSPNLKRLVSTYGKSRTPLYKRPNKQTFVETQDWRENWSVDKNIYSINDNYCIEY